MTTFEDYRNSKTFTESIGGELNDESLMKTAGYLYLDSYWIARGWGAYTLYHTQIGRDEVMATDLEMIERVLWNEFVADEVGGSKV